MTNDSKNIVRRTYPRAYCHRLRHGGREYIVTVPPAGSMSPLGVALSARGAWDKAAENILTTRFAEALIG